MTAKYQAKFDCNHYGDRHPWIAVHNDGEVEVRFEACYGCAALLERIGTDVQAEPEKEPK